MGLCRVVDRKMAETTFSHRYLLVPFPGHRDNQEAGILLFRGRDSRHTYSSLLRFTGAELKTMQELLRHSTIRVTLDTYTQAVTTEKRKAQEAVVALLFPGKTQER